MDRISVVCALVAVLLFANTWQGDFVYDDRWVSFTNFISARLTLTIRHYQAHHVHFFHCTYKLFNQQAWIRRWECIVDKNKKETSACVSLNKRLDDWFSFYCLEPVNSVSGTYFISWTKWIVGVSVRERKNIYMTFWVEIKVGKDKRLGCQYHLDSVDMSSTRIGYRPSDSRSIFLSSLDRQKTYRMSKPILFPHHL